MTSGNTHHTKFHASEASGSDEEDFNIFLCISQGWQLTGQYEY